MIKDKPGAGVPGIAACAVADTGGPLGGVPVVDAWFVIEPASTSAWVTTYVAVQVNVAPGANVVGSPGLQLNPDIVPDPVNAPSAIETPDNVTSPMVALEQLGIRSLVTVACTPNQGRLVLEVRQILVVFHTFGTSPPGGVRPQLHESAQPERTPSIVGSG